MRGHEIERRLIQATDVFYDESGNPSVGEYIDDIKIVNVPESMRFVRPESLGDEQKQILLDLLRDSLLHSKTEDDTLTEGSPFATCVLGGVKNTPIPTEILLGILVKVDDRMQVKGNVRISYHTSGEITEPEIIGFEIDDEKTTKPVRHSETEILGATLSPERYKSIVDALQAIPKDASFPHPGTKEFVRYGEKFKALSESLKTAGLSEIPGAMFKAEGLQKESENSPGSILTAVHPYYLEYHGVLGQRDKLTPEARAELMEKYDKLFSEHHGPLVVVEEEDKIIETLKRLRRIGRQGDTYFVITENKNSSLFPYTTNLEFMNLLRELGTDELKFVGGHDSGNRPYSGARGTYSGCLRGLANRIEKRGFPKIETMEGYTYS